MINLVTALRLSPLACVALVGSGGKSTALFTLARQFSGPVLATTATHLSQDQVTFADRWIQVENPGDVAQIEASPLTGLTLVTGRPAGIGRVSGLDSDTLLRLKELADQWRVPFLIEADGSRLRPLKAPADHEPAIPTFIDTVVLVAGMSAIDRPLTAEWVHRPERYAELSGLSLGDLITPGAVARVLTHPKGGLKNIPAVARRCLLLTQAHDNSIESTGHSIAQLVLSSFESVVISTLLPDLPDKAGWVVPGGAVSRPEVDVLAVIERVAGIILAAGASVRMGVTKQLLDWKGQPFVRQVAETALSAGLSHVLAVTGADQERVGAAVEGLEVFVVHNPFWETGQSASIREGLLAMKQSVGSAIFLLSDQPQISPTLLRALIERHATTLAPIVAPLVFGRKGNPVLFDKVTFPELLQLKGDTGGRALFSRFPVEWLEWHSEEILMDVDTQEDYQKLLNIDPPTP